MYYVSGIVDLDFPLPLNDVIRARKRIAFISQEKATNIVILSSDGRLTLTIHMMLKTDDMMEAVNLYESTVGQIINLSLPILKGKEIRVDSVEPLKEEKDDD